jgi:glycosyltransferase involved in cell wall biosynthesis
VRLLLSVEVIEKFAGEFRVKYFYKVNGAKAKAKNKGIVESKGDYITFLDADDKWTFDKLKKQLPNFDLSTKTRVVYTKVAQLDNLVKFLFALTQGFML